MGDENEEGGSVKAAVEAEPANEEDLLNSLNDGLKSRVKFYKVIKPFADKERFSRKDIVLVENYVKSFDALKEIDKKLAIDHCDWMNASGKTEETLNKENHKFSSLNFDPLLEQYLEVSDKVEDNLLKLLEENPNKPEVVALLSKYKPPSEPVFESHLNRSFDRTSVFSGRGADYAKVKIPKIKDDIEKEFARILKQHDLGAGSKNSPEELIANLARISKTLDVDGKFEKLLRELEESEVADDEYIESFEDWQSQFVCKVDTLKCSLNKRVKSMGSGSNKTFQTFFKKLDPPTFSGDTLDYVEWKAKWKAVVSTCEMPPDFELDRLKENLPSQAKKKLFDVESIVKAWDILDQLYGDTKLISQKLKNKMKALTPKSTEPHEIVIEINEEVDYLVKRLSKLGVSELLKTDNDYLNAIYSKLPAEEQRSWDIFPNINSYVNEWQAFSTFLNEAYLNALRKRTRVESLKDMKDEKAVKVVKQEKTKLETPVCYFCQEEGHKRPQCKKDPKNKGKVVANKVNVKAENDDKVKKSPQCPLCNQNHTWSLKNKPNSSPRPSDRFYSCPDFLNLDPQTRGELLEKQKACIICTSWTHQKQSCSVPLNIARCSEKENGKPCEQLHSQLVHGCKIPYCLSARVGVFSTGNQSKMSDIDVHANTLALLQDISTGNAVARTQFDDGSTRILVTHSYAKKAGFQSVPAIYNMQVVGKGWETVEDVMYLFELTKKSGETVKVWGYGINSITDSVQPSDLSNIRSSFPHVPEDAFKKQDERPVDILIGMNFFGLHPGGGTGKDKVGNLKALKSDFGCGWVIGGSDPRLKPSKVQLSAQALAMTTVCKVEMKPFEAKDFFELETLGVLPPKRCNRCTNCKSCTEEGTILSCKEEEEFRMINDNVFVENGKTTCNYPFIKDPNVLSNNRQPMLMRSQKLEQSLKRRNLLGDYNAEFQKFIDRGVVTEVSKEELHSYDGPINYISHHGILQPLKVTTPLRLVSNSSQDNRGHSLNSCVAKGPNSLCNMYDMLLKFRTYEVGLAFDIFLKLIIQWGLELLRSFFDC